MTNFLLIFTALFLGILLKSLKDFPKNTSQVLNSFIIYISLPALTLHYVPSLDFSWEMLLPFLMPVFVLALAWLFFILLNQFFRWDKKTLGVLILLSGLGNIVFFGFPIIEGFYSSEGLEIAIVAGQSAFLMASIFGVLIAVLHSEGKASFKNITLKVLSFPPFIAFVLGGFLVILNIEVQKNLDEVFKILGSTLTSVAMVSVGFQITVRFSAISPKDIILPLSYKLILAPILIYFIFASFLEVDNLIFKVSVIEAGMPSMVVAVIIANQYKLNEKLASLLISLGTLLAFPMLYAWYLILGA